MTLSAADRRWPDLSDILDPDPRLPAVTGNQKVEFRIRGQLLNENLMIVAQFFHERAEFFVEHVLFKVFDVRDYWVRYEW